MSDYEEHDLRVVEGVFRGLGRAVMSDPDVAGDAWRGWFADNEFPAADDLEGVGLVVFGQWAIEHDPDSISPNFGDEPPFREGKVLIYLRMTPGVGDDVLRLKVAPRIRKEFATQDVALDFDADASPIVRMGVRDGWWTLRVDVDFEGC